ncbi:hypothetical protein B566_EDAN010057 [Ephemera danica]|nr:hypothetical protein B566_EDAN010057 [Ephemera danica]
MLTALSNLPQITIHSAHGLSLLRPITADRTCSEIGIPQKYYICSYEKDLNLDEPRVLDSAQLLVQHNNMKIKPLHNFNFSVTLKKKFPFMHRRIYLIVALVILMWLLFKSVVHYVEMDFHRKNFMLYDFNNKNEHKSSCQIPDYDPFDDSIKKYITKWPAVDCGNPQLPLTYLDDDGFINVNESAVKECNIPRNRINCFYQEYIKEKERVYAPYVVVQCYDRKKLIYESSHLQVLPLEPSLDLTSKKALQENDVVNVLILGLDSMSRLNFIRQLPKTYKLITKDLEFDVIKGLTKVGGNTFPNMIVMLSGLAQFSYDKSLGPFIRKTDVKGHLDDIPIIWKNFSAKGYVTMYLDDSTEYCLFNYHADGFIQPPTNYYTRPFWLALEEQNNIVSSDKRCKGHVPHHRFFMKFYEQFVNNMHRGQNAFFSFGMMDSLSHNALNSVQVLDEELAAFVTRLHTSGVLDNTLMLLLGDHGHNFDDIRKTKIGRVEESMPFLGIHLPESLKHLRENVQKNLNILTSWHDVYETLMDVAMKNTALQSKQVRYGYRGLSLLRPITADRTCSEIGIPQNNCICSYEKDLNLDEPRVLDSAQLLVQHVNKLLQPHANLCATLTLDAVISSQLVIPHGYSKKINPSDFETQIRVLITVQPSGAMLEGLVVANAWSYSKIEGEVSRINRYGNQSVCIDDIYITEKMYCFCKQ